MRIIGHRGSGKNGASELPENTLASFRQAERDGATMVELDVRLSADGVAFVIHDDTVDRTTDGTGCICGLTAEQMDALTTRGEKVPRLEAVLSATPLDLNIEIKVSDGKTCPPADRAWVAEELARVLGLDPNGDRHVVVSSFDLAQLLAVRNRDPRLRLGLLSTEPEGFELAKARSFQAVHPLASTVTTENVSDAHDAGLRVYPWTVNDTATMRRLIHLGVDGIITDHPSRLLEVARRLTPPG